MDKLEFIKHEKRKRGLLPPESMDEAFEQIPPEEGYLDAPISDQELFGNEDLFEDEESEQGDYIQDADTDTSSTAKNAQRHELVRRYMKLYLRYMRPSRPLSPTQEQYLLEDLVDAMRNLCKAWAVSTASRRSRYRSGDEEDAMQMGCLAVYPAYLSDKANGVLRRFPVAYFQRIFRNRAIDHFRKIYGTVSKAQSSNGKAGSAKKRNHQKMYADLSIEAIAQWENESRMDRIAAFSVNPFEESTDRENSAELSNRILMLYYRELMDYEFEPQKPVIVMYGRVLFQICKNLYPEYSQLYPDSWDAERHESLMIQAVNSTKLSSTEWAYDKMGIQNLRYLGEESEKIMQLHVDPSLYWGKGFRSQLPEPAAYNVLYEENGRTMERPQTWGDLVFTETFPDRKKANHWITDINKSTIEKASRKLKQDPELSEFILTGMGSDNLMLASLKKQAKEAEK
jgi:DNA-directed RNA polymerase specialized sigma24 family protein